MHPPSTWNWLWLAGFLALTGCNTNDDTESKPATAPVTSAPLSAAEIAKRFSALKFEILDISEQNYQNRVSLALVLSSPLDAKTDFQSQLQVLGSDNRPVAGGWLLADNGLSLYFQNIEPEQTYRVQVSGRLTDALGRMLNQDRTEEIKTRSLPPTATFASRGSVLPSGLKKGLPVDSINVAEVDIDFHRIPDNKIPEFLSKYGVAGGRSTWELSRNDWDENQLHRFLNLAYSGRFSLKTEKNTRVRSLLPLEDIKELRQTGLYLAVMKGAGSYPEQYQTTPFVISNLGLQVRLYSDHMQVIASTLADAGSVKGAKISLYDHQGAVLDQAETDKQGLARLKTYPDAVLLVATQGEDTALVDLKAPSLDLSEFKQGERRGQAQEIFIYGPRDIYRPGETLDLSMLLRDPDGQYQASLPLKLKLERPDGSLMELPDLTGDSLGYYHLLQDIPSDAALGSWKLRASLAQTSVEHQYKFRVEQFLPERLSLTLTAGAEVPKIQNREAPLRFDIEGRYLYGAVANANRFSTRVSVQSERSPFETLPGFEFGDLQETTSQEFDAIEQQLSAQGRFAFESDSQWVNVQSPVQIQVEVSLFDDGGRPVSRHFRQSVWPADTSIGIRPASFKADSRVNAQSNVEFEVIKANRQGELLAGNIEVKLIQEAKNPYWSYSDNSGWELMFNEKAYPVLQQELSLQAGQKTTLSLPVEWGQYRVDLRDPATNQLTSFRFTAGEDWWYDSNNSETEQAAPRPDQIQIQLDKAQYREGDTANVKLTPPFDSEALISVEADGILWSSRQSLSKSGTEVEIPIGADWHRHDLYISAIALKPGEAGAKPGPNRAFGLLHLPLDREARKLALKIDAPTQAEPGQSYQVKLRLSQPPAAGQEIAVTLAAVDAGVLSLTHFKTPDAHQWLFEPRRYGADIKDLYHRLISNGNDPWAKLRFGGDAALDLSGKQPDEDVEILSLFKGPVRFNAQGEAEIPLELPDFNGKMRLMALAFSKDQYGWAEQEVTIAAPIVAELSQPRFLAGGDQSQLSLAVQNLTTEAQTLTLNLTASYPLKLNSSPQQLQLQPQQKQVLQFPISAAILLGKGEIELSLNGIKLPNQTQTSSLTRQWTLGVRPAWPAQTRQQFIALEAGQSLSLTAEMLAGLAPSSLQGRLSIQTTPPLNLATHLHELLTYPYGCLEQTTSAAYPIALGDPERMRALGLDAEIIGSAERKERLQQAFTRLSNLQKSNGSYGLWNGNSDEEHWLTAYVADFLLNARDAGFDVPATLLERNLKRLEDYLRTEGVQPEERWSNAPEHYRLAYRAYAGYVLARVNRARLGDLRTLFDKYANDDKTGLPLTQLGLALIRQGDNQRGDQALQQATALRAKAWQQRYHWYSDYGSSVRDEAQILALLASNQRLPADFSQRLLQLSERIRQDHYLSTQERNSLFMLGLALPNAQTQSWQASLHQADGSTQTLQGGNLNQKLTPDQLKAGLKLDYPQGPMLFAQLSVNGYPQRPMPETSHPKLSLERYFYRQNGQALTSNRIASGDLVLVEVRLSNYWQRLPDLMLVELLPAGFELENQNMDNSIKFDNIQIDGEKVSEILAKSPFKHREFRFDRYIETYDLDPSIRQQRSFYLMRAVTPGSYQLPTAKVEDMYHPTVFAVGPSQFDDKLIVTPKTANSSAPTAVDTPAITPVTNPAATPVPAATPATETVTPAADAPTATAPATEAVAPTAVDAALVATRTTQPEITVPGLAKTGLPATVQHSLAALLNAGVNRDSELQDRLRAELDALPKTPRGDRKTARKLNDSALEAFRAADYPTAIGRFQQALVADPADIEILNNLGYAQLKQQDLAGAELTLWTALSKQAGRAGAWANLAEVLAQNDQAQAAVAAWINTLHFSGNPEKTRTLLEAQSVDAALDARIRAGLKQALQP